MGYHICLISPDDEQGHAEFERTPAELEALGIECDHGQTITPPITPISVASQDISKGLWPDFMIISGAGAPVLNERAKLLVEAMAPDQVQFLPLIMPNKERRWIANILTALPCLDMTESEVEYIPGTDTILFIEKMVLNEQTIKSHRKNLRIFRMKESLPWIVMDDVLAKALATEGLTGFDLTAVEDWEA